MPDTRVSSRLSSTAQVNKQIAETREVINHAVELLRSQPKPDTFAGRRTHEPFPTEDKEL